MKRGFLILVCVALLASVSNATVVLGGTAQTYIEQALNTLGVNHQIVGSMFVDPTGYGAGDTIILSQDGGIDNGYDYTGFLNAGGHLIVVGGSNYDPYRAWVAGYFNTTDTGSGWHTDGAWHKDGNLQPTQFMPNDFTFQNNSVTFHMLGFLPTDNTLLLGHNDEITEIAAIRGYNNGGWFYYMALDPGPYSNNPFDQDGWTVPFVQSALAAQYNAVPEPGTIMLLGSSVLSLGFWRRFKK